MKYNYLTQDIVQVSEIGFGAWQLGIESGWDGLSETEAIQLVHKAIDSGVNFFDTAPNYGLGTSELRLGKALKQKDRDQYVINTKFGHTVSGITNYNSNHIRESLEGSLKRLKTEYVDSLIIHNPPINYLDGNKNDHYEILEKLKNEGKIKAYGASLDKFEELKILLETTNSQVIEVFFNVFHQDIAQGFEMANTKNVGIIVKVPLDSGWLTGKYNSESQFTGVRSRWTRDDIKKRAELVEMVKEIILPEKNISKIAIAFCLAFDAVSTVIPGNLSINQLINNISSSNYTISHDIIEKFITLYQNHIKYLDIPW